MYILELNVLLIPWQKEKEVELCFCKKNCTLKSSCQFTAWNKCFKTQAAIELQEIWEYENYKFHVSHFFHLSVDIYGVNPCFLSFDMAAKKIGQIDAAVIIMINWHILVWFFIFTRNKHQEHIGLTIHRSYHRLLSLGSLIAQFLSFFLFCHSKNHMIVLSMAFHLFQRIQIQLYYIFTSFIFLSPPLCFFPHHILLFSYP